MQEKEIYQKLLRNMTLVRQNISELTTLLNTLSATLPSALEVNGTFPNLQELKDFNNNLTIYNQTVSREIIPEIKSKII